MPPEWRRMSGPGHGGPGMHMTMTDDRDPDGVPTSRPGFAPGPRFGPPFGHHGHGPWGPRRGPGGRRGRRGNVRAGVLALLSEEAKHGYALMNELAERSGGLWRPSPGSVYPVLAQLQDEGLVASEESDGRRTFSLTESGRTYVADHPDEMSEPWRVAEAGPLRRVQSIMAGMESLGAAVEQVARLGDDAQAAQAVAVLDDARKRLYRILAEDDG